MRLLNLQKLVDETQMKKARDEFGFEEVVAENSYKKKILLNMPLW